VYESTQKVTIISNYAIMLRCYARYSLSFVLSCNVSSCRKEIWV